MATLPCSVAIDSGVTRYRVVALTSAPPRSSCSTAVASSDSTARCSAVTPAASTSFAPPNRAAVPPGAGFWAPTTGAETTRSTATARTTTAVYDMARPSALQADAAGAVAEPLLLDAAAAGERQQQIRHRRALLGAPRGGRPSGGRSRLRAAPPGAGRSCGCSGCSCPSPTAAASDRAACRRLPGSPSAWPGTCRPAARGRRWWSRTSRSAPACSGGARPHGAARRSPVAGRCGCSARGRA